MFKCIGVERHKPGEWERKSNVKPPILACSLSLLAGNGLVYIEYYKGMFYKGYLSSLCELDGRGCNPSDSQAAKVTSWAQLRDQLAAGQERSIVSNESKSVVSLLDSGSACQGSQ
jgi:hypothetical protein